MTGVAGSAVDVVVVGGGPAGCAAAAIACRQGCSVVVLDRSPPRGSSTRGGSAGEGWRAGEGAGPGTERLVDEVFGPETGAFRPGAHLRCPGIVVAWGSPEPSCTEHLLNPLGPAWNLDRHRFDADLRAGARALGADVRTVTGTTVERDGAGWVVRFATADGTGTPTHAATDAPTGAASVRGRVVIDASGRGARVARSLAQPLHAAI